jgi:peptidoglycan/xylan/chitin deacetylase (PgdA/CDA1 family)/SAM-dependent methyltransferase
MTNRVATVIRCADLVQHVYSTLASVERQTPGRGEIVLVTDDSTPALARDWIARLAAARGLVTAHSSASRPGAVRNTGVRATQAPHVMCLDSGDLLDPRFHEMACAKLDDEPDVDLVTSWILLRGPGSNRRVIAPLKDSAGGGAACDLDAAIGNTGAIHGASVFRRGAWTALDGFDESLPALDDYDFWLRVLQAGKRCAVVQLPLLVRWMREDALYRRSWAAEPHAAAIGTLAARHAALFGRDPAHALIARELVLRDLGARYTELLARRDAGLEELESLKARVADLREKLAPSERDSIDFGDLKRTTPVARNWGYERGTPVDRHYIERFLEAHAADIRGAVLEVQEADYTKRFGGDRVTRSDVVDLNASNPLATVVSDLRSAANIAAGTYDCVILTQTLHVVDDMRAVIAECARILEPEGVLLVTLPCSSRVCLEYGDEGDFWRVTEAGARTLFSDFFPGDALDVQARGNVLVNAAFLYGLACHELDAAAFEADDPYFPLLVTVRAQKPGTPGPEKNVRHDVAAAARRDGRGAAILLYHRVGTLESDVHGLSIPPQAFRAQMAHLRERYHPMPLDALVDAARDGHAPAGAIAVTFDDGYVDNYTGASPILSELGVPATFFLTTERLADDSEFWWDALERMLLSSRGVPIELHIDLPTGPHTFETRTIDQRLAAHSAVYHAIVGSPSRVRDDVVGALARWSGASAPVNPPHRRMKPDEIVALAAREGHAIGAHSVRHLMLPRQPLEVQREEIEESRRALETLLARRVIAFAYPFGACSAETVDAVRTASFEMALTCDDTPLAPHADPLRLPRLEVTPHHAGHFGDWLARRLGV